MLEKLVYLSLME